MQTILERRNVVNVVIECLILCVTIAGYYWRIPFCRVLMCAISYRMVSGDEWQYLVWDKEHNKCICTCLFFFSPCGCVIFPYDTFLCTNVTNLEVRAASKICLAAVTAASDYMDPVVKGLQG